MGDVRNVRVVNRESPDDRVHLPGPVLLDHATLCGWVWPDRVEFTTELANCPMCIDALRHAHELWRERKRYAVKALLGFGLVVGVGCTAPSVGVERKAAPVAVQDKALCVPWPDGPELSGLPTHLHAPQCVDDELPVACELGTVDQSCACESDADCDAAWLSVETLSTTNAPLPMVCELGRCVWVLP